jgi:cysteine synthase B
MPSAIVPKIYDPTLADANLSVRTEDAYAMVRHLARLDGLLVSVSAGAALAGCIHVARTISPREHAVFVTIFADSGDKYLSERFWDEAPAQFSLDRIGR